MEEAAKIPAGMQIFAASPSDDNALAAAKKYIKHHGLTSENVKILKNERVLCVETKKPVDLSNEVFDINSQD